MKRVCKVFGAAMLLWLLLTRIVRRLTPELKANDPVEPSCPLNLYNGEVGPDQMAFITKARQIAESFDVQIAYLFLCGHDDKHVLPFFHVLPGRLVQFNTGWAEAVFSKQHDMVKRLNIPE